MSQLRIQNSRTVAYRALCLGALLKRGEWELTVQNSDESMIFENIRDQITEKYQGLNDQLLDWLSEEKITPHLAQTEKHLLQKPMGTWSEPALISVGWRIEALGTMLWVLNRLDTIPMYDNPFTRQEVLAPLDLMNSTIDFIWMASLRPEKELLMARDCAEQWNWRSQARELKRFGVHPPEGLTFTDVIRMTAERAVQNKYLDYLIDGDFPAFGKAYHTLSEDEYALATVIAYERYFALNWVCEMSNSWENIRIDL